MFSDVKNLLLNDSFNDIILHKDHFKNESQTIVESEISLAPSFDPLTTNRISKQSIQTFATRGGCQLSKFHFCD